MKHSTSDLGSNKDIDTLSSIETSLRLHIFSLVFGGTKPT